MAKIRYLLMLIIFFTSCSEIQIVDCSSCYQIKPEWGTINIKTTINDENPNVPLVIYIGVVEDSVIEYIDTSYFESYNIDVPINEYYSVVAKYTHGNKTIFAIDGDEIKTKLITEECDVDCYIIHGGDIDVRLKDY